MNNILTNQNSPSSINLLKASTVAYKKAKYGEIGITYALLCLAISYLICYIFYKNDTFKMSLFICSFSISVINVLMFNFFKGNTAKGAVLKEMFDYVLFHLPWKTTLQKLPQTEIDKLAQQYTGDDIKDWYDDNLSDKIPNKNAIAILQCSNTIWDINLRKLYIKDLKIFLGLYTVVLWTLLILNHINCKEIFLVHFSILSFYTHFISLIRGHNAAIKKRSAVKDILQKLIDSNDSIETTTLRDIQDEIFLSRQEAAKVPDFFFRCKKDKLNAITNNFVDSMNQKYL